MRRAVAIGLLATLWGGAAAAHGRSQSFLEGRIRDRRVELTVRLAGHDLAAAIPGLDADRDGALEGAELLAGTDRVASSVRRGVQVRLQGDPCPVDAPRVQGVGEPAEEVQVDLTARCPREVDVAEIDVGLLPSLEPPHVTIATFAGPGLDASHVFTVTAPTATLQVEPRTRGFGNIGPLWLGAGLFAALSAGLVAGRFLARSRGP